MWLAVVFLIAIVFIYVMTVFTDDSLTKAEIFFSGAISGFCILVSVIIVVQEFFPSITPMDVYQGRTTLEYTVVDGVKVDSCVIFKE